MSNRPKIHATNAINSIRQYRCTNAGVSNYIKISTVVDDAYPSTKDMVSNYIKISTVVDLFRHSLSLLFQTTLKFLLL